MSRVKNHTVKYQSQILFLGKFDIGAETFMFDSVDDARKNKKAMKNLVRLPLRPFCFIKLIPVIC